MSNLPQILFGVLFFVIIVPFTILIIVLVIKGRKQAWKGVIIDKEKREKRDFDTDRLETSYIVVIKLESGREKHMEVDLGRYNEWNVGDKLEKVSGEMWPMKV